MSATIWNGESRSLSIETGKKLTVAAMSGTYSVLTTAGAGVGTALASNATGGTYGPYAGPITVLLSSSALSEIDFDVAVTPVIESDTFVKASKTLTGGLETSAGGTVINGTLVGGAWAAPPSMFRLLMNGTGTVTLDSRDANGVITPGVYTTSLVNAVNQIDYPFAGDSAISIRATFTGTATAKVI